MTRRKGVKVICIECNVVFDSISDAAKFAGVTDACLGAALRSGGRSCGFHWFRLDGRHTLLAERRIESLGLMGVVKKAMHG